MRQNQIRKFSKWVHKFISGAELHSKLKKKKNRKKKA